MAEEYVSKSLVFFLRVDVDDCSEAAKEFGIEVLPSFLLVKDGEVLESFIGQDLTRVQREMNQILRLEEKAREGTEETMAQLRDKHKGR